MKKITMDEVHNRRLYLVQAIRREILAGVLAAAIALSGVGCSVAGNGTSEAPTNTIETAADSSVVTTDTSPEVTVEVPSATPETTPVETVKTIEEELAAAPEIDGLTKQIDLINNRIIYIYIQGNVYGVEVGDNEEILAGVYKPNVEVEGDEAATGVCLDAVVCRYLTEARIAEIPDGEDKIAIALPFDIENNNASITVSAVDRVYNSVTSSFVEVESDESMPLVGSYYAIDEGEEDSMFYSFSLKTVSGDGFTHSDGTVDSVNGDILMTGYALNNEITSDNASSFLKLIVDDVDFVDNGIITTFGGYLGKDCKRIIMYSGDYTGAGKPLDLDDLLKIDDSYVFVSTVEGSESTGIIVDSNGEIQK